MSPTKLLPERTLARLFAYCEETGEDHEAVIIDAVDLHLDAIEDEAEGCLLFAAPISYEASS